MGLRGPKPKPTDLQIARGDPGKRAKRRAKKEVKVPKGELAPPEYLDKEARAEWRRIQKGLKDCLVPLDRSALIVLCQTWSRYLKAARKLDKEENWVTVLTNKSGQEYEALSIYFKICKEQQALYVRLCGCFGMTPSDRTRLQLGNSEKTDSGENDLLGKIIDIKAAKVGA